MKVSGWKFDKDTVDDMFRKLWEGIFNFFHDSLVFHFIFASTLCLGYEFPVTKFSVVHQHLGKGITDIKLINKNTCSSSLDTSMPKTQYTFYLSFSAILVIHFFTLPLNHIPLSFLVFLLPTVFFVLAFLLSLC